MGNTIKTVQISECNNCHSVGWRPVAQAIDFESNTCKNEFHYVACEDCGLVYLQNRPDVSELDVIYPPDYRPHRFNEDLGPFIANLRDRTQLRKVTAIRKYAGENAFIIDVGCGSGELLRLMRDYGHPSWRLAGVDFSETAAEAVEKLGLHAYRERFEVINWTDDAPDVIMMSHVVEHLDDPSAVAKKAFDLLKPGGYFIVETPSIEGWDAKWFRQRYWGGWHTPRHWILYNEDTLFYLLDRQGFRVVETTYMLSPNFWLQSLHHFATERMKMPRLAEWFDAKHFFPLLMLSGFDFCQKLLRGKTSNLRMVGRKPH